MGRTDADNGDDKNSDNKQKGDGDENNNSDDKDGNAGRDDGWSVMKGNGK